MEYKEKYGLLLDIVLQDIKRQETIFTSIEEERKMPQLILLVHLIAIAGWRQLQYGALYYSIPLYIYCISCT